MSEGMCGEGTGPCAEDIDIEADREVELFTKKFERY